MANDVGNITASLKLESAAFIRELNRAAQATAKSTTAMQRSMASLNKGFAIAGASLKTFIAGFAGLQGLRAFKQIVAAADEVGDAATKLGVSAEELQRFRFAAEQAGVAVGGMDSALKIFSRNLAQGKLEVVGTSLGEKFKNFIDQIARAPDEAAQTLIAMKGLNKQFDIGLQIAREGPEAFRKWFDGAAVYSAKALEQADRLDKQFRAMQQALFVGFGTGVLETFTGKLEDLSEDDLKTLETNAKAVGAAIAGSIKTFIEDVKALAGVGIAIVEEFQRTQANLPPRMGGKGGTVARPFDMGGPLPPGAPGAAQAGFGPGGAGGPMTGLIVEQTKAFGEQAMTVEQLAAAKRALAEADALWNSQVSQGMSIIQATQTPLEQYADALREIAELHQAKAITAETAARAEQQAMLGLVDTYVGGLSQITSTLAGAFQDNKAFAIANAVMNVAQGITQALTLPFPLNWAQVAAVTAAGVAQIANIRSARPGSAKNPSASKGNGASATRASAGGEAAIQDRAVFINLQGSGRYSRMEVQGLIEQLIDAQKDGARLVLAQP